MLSSKRTARRFGGNDGAAKGGEREDEADPVPSDGGRVGAVGGRGAGAEVLGAGIGAGAGATARPTIFGSAGRRTGATSFRCGPEPGRFGAKDDGGGACGADWDKR